MTLNEHYAKLDGLIEAAYINCPDGAFFLEMPTKEWEAVEASLNRSAMDKKFMHRVFKWRGEYVARGAKWMVHTEPPTPVASA